MAKRGIWARLLELIEEPKASPATLSRRSPSDDRDLPAPREASGPRDVVGDNYMAVRGESFHRRALNRAMAPKKTGRTVFPMIVLRPEPTNTRDPNAVQVLLGDDLIGYVPSDAAADFAEAFAGGDLYCSAEIRRQDPKRDWNVVLRVDYGRLRDLRKAERERAMAQVLKPLLEAVADAAIAYEVARTDGSTSEAIAELKRRRDRAIAAARSAEPRPTAAQVAHAAGVSPNTVGKITKDAASSVQT